MPGRRRDRGEGPGHRLHSCIRRTVPNLGRPRRIRFLLVAAAVGLLFALLRATPLFERLERNAADARTAAAVGLRPPDSSILLAVIGQGDVDDLRADGYDWPWPLELNAYAFDWLAAAGARAVVVDVFHTGLGAGPEETGATDPNARLLAEQQAREADRLADSFRRVGTILLACELSRDPPPTAAALAREPVFLEKLPQLPQGYAFVMPHVRLPVVRLLRAAGGVGFANAGADPDGVARRLPALALWEGPRRVVPSLAYATALALGLRPDASSGLLNFRGDPDSYAAIRPADLVRAGVALAESGGAAPSVGSAVPERVRGRIVIWGVNLPGVKDVVTTPVADRFSGAEFQATVLDNLMHGDARIPASRGMGAAILLLLATAVGAFRSPWHRVLALLALATLPLVGGWFAFRAGLVLDLVTPLAALVTAFAAVTVFELLTEGRRNRWLERTLGQYLSPPVLDALKADPSLLVFGGRRREITVLFSDIVGFTTFSEKLGPEPLVRLLNRYLTVQSHAVLSENGVIDKFIGDAVMAFFGDPLDDSTHALRACRAALASQAALADLEPLARELSIPPLRNRIGINTGVALVGNMGSERRFDYTCIGDTVNLASRLEGANRVFGTAILIGDATRAAAGGAILARPIAMVRVVGRGEPVAIHELLALREGAPAALVEHAEAFARAGAALRADRLDEALRALEEAERARPGDGATAWLRRLAADLASGAHPRPWDGTVTLATK